MKFIEIDDKGVERGANEGKRQRLKEEDTWIFRLSAMHITNQVSKILPDEVALERPFENGTMIFRQLLESAAGDPIAFFLDVTFAPLAS